MRTLALICAAIAIWFGVCILFALLLKGIWFSAG
jgi:hypothetical protein